jgi:hypothetical protein
MTTLPTHHPSPEQKRAPICGILSIIASLASWLLVFVLVRLHPNGIGLLFGELFAPFCALGGMVFAIVAWARREHYWAFSLVSLLLGLALVGLFCYLGGGIDEKV